MGPAFITFCPQLRATGWFSAAAPVTTDSPAQVVQQALPVAPREVAVAVTPFAPSSAAVPAVPVVPASAPVAAVLAPELLVLQARAESWVRVADVKNGVLLQNTLVAGETATVAGAVPLAVTIGRADAVDVLVGGQPMDRAALGSGTVARFAVK